MLHEIPIDSIRGHVDFGYVYTRNNAHGDEWDYDAHQLLGTLSTDLTDSTTVTIGGSYAYRPHDNASTYGDRIHTRRDNLWEGNFLIDQELADKLTGTLRYRYQESDSDTAVFDYDRHMVGVYLTYKFW